MALPATRPCPIDSRGPFVGRDRELDELRAALQVVLAGSGRFHLLTGEPGIGKTRLAEQLAEHAAACGAAVWWGRCSEDGNAPAYWPWIQVLRAALRELSPDVVVNEIGPAAATLTPLLPELRDLLGDLPAEVTHHGDAERARFHLFEAIAAFVRAAAASRPLLIVLDDLHAADRPSLLLLGAVARRVRESAVLLIGCYRDLEVRQTPELASLLGDVASRARRLPLRGITEADVGRYIEGSAGIVPPSRLVGAVHRATEGNPFFVEEVVSLLAAEGRLSGTGEQASRLGIPEGVREAIRRRLAPIEGAANDVLSIAAVVGRQFDVACLERVVGRPRPWLLQVLDDALAAGVIRETGDAPGQYRFAHALIRETIYEDMPAARRLELHRRIGCALEALYGADREPHLPELACHFYAAAPVGDAGRALDYCVAAAERATRLLACEDAVAHYERALRTLAFVDVGEWRRCELLQALGEAQDLAGDIEGATVTFHRAAAIARALRAPALLARAALGAGGQWATKFTASPFDKSDVGLLEEALGALGPSDRALRAKLSARLALSLFLAGRREQGLALGAEAVELARQLGAPDVLAYALRVQHGGLLGPDRLADRLLVSAELDAMARATGDRELALRAKALRVQDLFESGDVDGAEAALDEHARLAETLRDPFDLWLSQMARATWEHMRGRLDECERRSTEALVSARGTPGQQAAEENADACVTFQAFQCRRDRGTLAGFEPTLLHWADRHVTVPSVRALPCVALAELGRMEEARQQFERLAASDFTIIPRDVMWMSVMPLVAETAVMLGDAPRAAILYDLLAPFADRVAVSVTPACSGAVARFLGLLATLLERTDAARRHFEQALALNARLGAVGHHAHTQADYATMLVTLDGTPAARVRARSLAREAAVTARRLGYVPLADRAERLAAELDDGRVTDPPPALARDAARDDYVLRREGEYWTVTFAGTTVRLRTSKGLELLAILLRQPGTPLRAIDLVAGGTAGEAGRRFVSFGDAGEVLDARARRDYALRVERLSQDLAQARSAGDGERVVSVREELRFVRAELSRGVGIGGRPRRAASSDERARVSATRALRQAIDRIADVHPALAGHLRVTVRTGTACAYVPDPRLPATWKT